VTAEVGEAVIAEKVQAKHVDTVGDKVWREVLSWFWVILAFLVIEGGLVQARVIPSGSMERTVLIGDHLIVSRFGYDIGIPFTDFHEPLLAQAATPADHRVPRAVAG
jgi:signal peptidase I